MTTTQTVTSGSTASAIGTALHGETVKPVSARCALKIPTVMRARSERDVERMCRMEKGGKALKARGALYVAGSGDPEQTAAVRSHFVIKNEEKNRKEMIDPFEDDGISAVLFQNPTVLFCPSVKRVSKRR